MPGTSTALDETPLILVLLRRADDALVLGHRLSEWCGHAPTLEEDLALANIALDQIGLARALYTEVGTLTDHDEDQLAYLRTDRQYRNCLLVEQPNGDFAHTMVRQFFYSAFVDPFWRASCTSCNPAVAAIAAKAEKESAYHLRHAAEWLIRLGGGTPESHRRAAAALDALWPFTNELFEIDSAETALIADGIIPDPPAIRPTWDSGIDRVLARATLARPTDCWMHSGGRRGLHSEHLGYLLAEMQSLHRTYPGAKW
ncbi:MAG TPA: 1,2-phenylacetyl-CoA epoxidase subunit PaaC [Acetobacteraceae bacterium]|nr:1,2-phenylacetyl-CoA epoxidase subunit PaaC [Acetobacteraceae bacterium]